MFTRKSRPDGLENLTVDFWCVFKDVFSNICCEMTDLVTQIIGHPLTLGRGRITDKSIYCEGERYLQVIGVPPEAATALIEFLQKKIIASHGGIEANIAKVQASMKIHGSADFKE